MTRKEILVDEIFKSVFGEPWHGTSSSEILSGVTEEQAFAKPISNAHTIFELTLHLWAWTEEVLNRINGNSPKDPEMGDWPEAENYKAAGWENIKSNFFQSTEKLIEAVKNFQEDKLNEIVGNLKSAPLGTGISYEAMIHGLAQHNAYHSGQISILKKYF